MACKTIRNMEGSVSSIIVNNMWQWPRMKRAIVQDITAQTTDSFLPREGHADSFRWNNYPSGSFSTRTAWEALRTKASLVPWHRVVWCPRYVPRWSIIEWLVLLKCLAAKDQLLLWGVIFEDCCVFCGSASETHEHLFFRCEFTERVWMFLQINGLSGAGLGLQGGSKLDGSTLWGF